MGSCLSKKVRNLCSRMSNTQRVTNDNEGEDPYWTTETTSVEEEVVPHLDFILSNLLDQDNSSVELELSSAFEEKLRNSIKSEIARAILPTLSFYLKVVCPTTEDSVLTANRTEKSWNHMDSTLSLRKEPHFYGDRKGQRSAGDLLDRGDGGDELRVAKYSQSAMKKYNSAS